MKSTAHAVGRTVRTRRGSLRAGPGPRLRRRSIAATGFLAAVTLVATLAAPAQAVDYPTWQDLQNAKSNTAAAASQVAQIQEMIAGLTVQVAQTQAESEKRGAEFRVAQEKLDEATRRATDLQAQADAGKVTADAATRQAGQLAAQLYRTGGTDLSVNLFLDGQGTGKSADALLSKLGSMSKLVERSSDVYDQAQTARNAAQALGDQAKIAQTEREALRVEAEAALVAAQAAAEAAANALAESQAKSLELDAQLAFMQDAQATTTAGYEAGVAERARLAAIEAERARVAQAAADAAAAAASRNSGGGSTGSAGAGLGGGYVRNGWAVPASGRITDGFGPRPVVCGGGSCSKGFHSGTDIGAGCSASIYAANDGVVTYAGPNGTYGNFVQISTGDGIATGYAHIRSGGIFVSNGQRVSAGQNIASVGSTGASTGCHLHFEVRSNGSLINPQPFMADRGVPLG